MSLSGLAVGSSNSTPTPVTDDLDDSDDTDDTVTTNEDTD